MLSRRNAKGFSGGETNPVRRVRRERSGETWYDTSYEIPRMVAVAAVDGVWRRRRAVAAARIRRHGSDDEHSVRREP